LQLKADELKGPIFEKARANVESQKLNILLTDIQVSRCICLGVEKPSFLSAFSWHADTFPRPNKPKQKNGVLALDKRENVSMGMLLTTTNGERRGYIEVEKLIDQKKLPRRAPYKTKTVA